MNKGIGLAGGAWLIFLGADDALHEAETLAKVAAFIAENKPSDLVYLDLSCNSAFAGVVDAKGALPQG